MSRTYIHTLITICIGRNIHRKQTLRHTIFLKVVDVTFTLVDVTYFVIPIAMATMQLLFPCQVPFTESLFLPGTECHKPFLESDIHFAVIRILFALVELKQFCQIVLVGAQYAIYTLLVGCMYLWEELVGICEVKKFTTDYR